MRPLLVLLAVPLLAGVTAVSDEHFPLVQPPSVVQPAQPPPDRAASRQRVGWMWVCGGGPPTSLTEWFREADAIVRVRIDSQNAYDDPYSGSEQPTILTDLEVTVLDVFKLHPRGVGAGATMTITHLGGTIMRADGPDILIANDFPPPPVGTEWFLFLAWNDKGQQFRIDYLDEGAFQVVDGSVVRPRASRNPLRASDAAAFAEVLRRGGITPP